LLASMCCRICVAYMVTTVQRCSEQLKQQKIGSYQWVDAAGKKQREHMKQNMELSDSSSEAEH